MYVILLVVVPFVLSFSFGTVLHNDDNLDQHFRSEVGFKKYENTNPIYSPTVSGRELFKEHLYERHFNRTNITTDLQKIKHMRVTQSLYDAFSVTSKMVILLGAVAAVLTSGKMITEGSVIYHIVNKRSRSRSFLELVSYPLPLLLGVGILSSLAVTTIILDSFQGLNYGNMFVLSSVIILSGMVQGYIFGTFFSLLFRNQSFSILGTLGLIFGLPMLQNGSQVLLPYVSLLARLYHDIAVDSIVWNLLGVMLVVFLLITSFTLFQRGDFYQ